MHGLYRSATIFMCRHIFQFFRFVHRSAVYSTEETVDLLSAASASELVYVGRIIADLEIATFQVSSIASTPKWLHCSAVATDRYHLYGPTTSCSGLAILVSRVSFDLRSAAFVALLLL